MRSVTGAGASRLGAHGFDERRTEKVSHLVQIAGQAGARAQSFGSFRSPSRAAGARKTRAPFEEDLPPEEDRLGKTGWPGSPSGISVIRLGG